MKSLLDLLPLVVFFAGYYGAKHWTEAADSFLATMLDLLVGRISVIANGATTGSRFLGN